MRRAVSLALVLAIALGCDITGPDKTFSGDYVLQTINGQPLPYAWPYPSDFSYTLLSEHIAVKPGGSWRSERRVSLPDPMQPNDVTEADAGTFTYTRSSGEVSLIAPPYPTPFGTAPARPTRSGHLSTSGDVLTLIEGVEVWVYER